MEPLGLVSASSASRTSMTSSTESPAGNLLDRVAPLVGALADPVKKGLLCPARRQFCNTENKSLLLVIPYSVHINPPNQKNVE